MSILWNKYLVAILVVIGAVVIGIVSIKFLGNDNPVEEAAEAVILKETGLDVDLTPSDTKTVSQSISPSSSPSGTSQEKTPGQQP
jgi:hypothetical protein